MRIVFEPFVYDPINNGAGSGSLRTLRSAGGDLTDYGVAAIRGLRTRTTTRGSYKQGTSGEGVAALPAIAAYGFDIGDSYGVSIISGRMYSSTSVLDVLQNGIGLCDIGGRMTTTSQGVESVAVDAVATLRRFGAYGDETAVDYGIAYLPRVTTNNDYFDATGLTYVTAVQPAGYIYMLIDTETATVSDTLVASDAITYDITYAVIEHMIAGIDLYGIGRYNAELIAAMSVRDRVQVIYEELLTELLVAGDDMLANVVVTVAIIDSLTFSDAFTTQRMYNANIVDALTIASVARSVVLADITDPMVVSEALSGRRNAMAHLLDGMLTSDLLSGLAVFTVDLSDTFIAEDSVLGTMTLHALIEDGVRISVGLALDGVPYVATVMNTNTKGVTEYAPYDFNSVATYRGESYGAGPAGLFRLAGATDNGALIEASARTALARIAGGKQAQVDSAYLGYSSDGTVQLKTIVTEPDGSKIARVYQLNTQNADANRSGRIKLGRGVKSAYWSFEISNVLGADFTIDVIEMHVLALSRRI